jgi:hypothetical protein
VEQEDEEDMMMIKDTRSSNDGTTAAVANVQEDESGKPAE